MNFVKWWLPINILVNMFVVLHHAKYTVTWWTEMPAYFTSQSIVAEVWIAAACVDITISMVGLGIIYSLEKKA